MTGPEMGPTAPPRFDAAAELLAKDLSVGALACSEVLPTLEGDLSLRASLPALTLRLLLSGRGKDPERMPGAPVGDLRLLAPGGLPTEGARKLLCIVARRLSWALRQGSGRWLQRRNREHRLIRPGLEPFLGLLAELLVPEKPFWGQWRLSTARVSEELPGRILLEMSDGPAAGGAGRRALLAFDPRGRVSAGETPLADTPLGLLLRCGGPKGEISPMTQESEGAVALALTLALHGDMRWADSRDGADGDARPRSPESGLVGIGADDTLVEYCFRSAREWDMRASRFFGTWGDRDFFQILAVAGVQRTMVSHTVRDCPVTVSALTGILDHGPNPYRTQPRHFAQGLRASRCTDLDDTTVIFGGEQRLEQVARAAAEEAGPRTTQVHFGCDYHMIGDDAAGVCRRLAEEGLRVELMNPPLPRFTDETASDWWKRVLAPASAPPEKRKPLTVNLAGFAWPDDPALADLAGLLERFGVKVLGRFFPGAAGMEEHAAAALTATSPWAPVRKILAPLLAERGFTTIAPAAPYGARGTQAWLEAVLAKVGAAPPDPGFCELLIKERSPDWESLRKSAGERSIGLICDFGSAAEMCGPSFFFGLEPISFLLDLGFRVHVLGPRAAEVREGLSALPRAWLDRLRVVELAPEADPLEAARREGLRLVYCDALLTMPLKERGLTPWSIHDLEPGLLGAERSLRRLLGLSRRRLYSDFGKHLRPKNERARQA